MYSEITYLFDIIKMDSIQDIEEQFLLDKTENGTYLNVNFLKVPCLTWKKTLI